MGKQKRGKKLTQDVVYGSDDERAYSKEAAPDPTSSEYYHDEIDDFHAEKDKILIGDGPQIEPVAFSSDEEEGILDFDSEDSDEEIESYKKQIKHFRSHKFQGKGGSDDDAEEKEEDKAWGSRKKQFYGGDVDKRIDVGSDEDGDAYLEEKEALAIQQRLAQQLDEGDFSLDLFTTDSTKTPEELDSTQETVKKDLSKLSKKEKLKLLKKESPELLEIIEDYKTKLKELQTNLMPIYKLIKDETLPESKGTLYIETKVHLYLNYCVNINYYMILKSKKITVDNHPVIKRLLQFRNLCQQLETADEAIQSEMATLHDKIKNNELNKISAKTPVGTSLKKRKRKANMSNKKMTDMLEDSSDEEHEISFPNKRKKPDVDAAMENKSNDEDETEMQPEEEGEEEEGRGYYEFAEGDKRAISYQIAKNKGLTPKKKKVPTATLR